jgi:hypothetical protein
MYKSKLKSLIERYIFSILISVSILSMTGIYYLATFVVSPFQKIYFNESITRVQNGGSRNYYLELITRPDLKFNQEALGNGIQIDPQAEFTKKIQNGVVTVDFGQSLTPDQEYTLSFQKNTGISTLDSFKYKFKTKKLNIAYIELQNTPSSSIKLKMAEGEIKTLVKNSFILNMTMTPEYIIYSSRGDDKYSTAIDISIYNIETGNTKQLPGKYNQFFKFVANEESNQAIIENEDSSYSLLDLATLSIKPLSGTEGKYNSFLSFPSPQFLIYNTITFSSNTILFDLTKSTGILIGKFSKVLGLENTTGNICMSTYADSNKVFVYTSEGKIEEILLPVNESDEISTNNGCDKIAYKTLAGLESTGFTTHLYDTKSKQVKEISTETSLPAGEFVVDKSGKYIGYGIVVGSGTSAYNNFFVYNTQASAKSKPLETIKNATSVFVY